LLRVGVIGLGRMGKLHFLNALHMKDVKVVVVACMLKRNMERDLAKNNRLEVEGWKVLRFWEHEVAELEKVLDKIHIELG